MTIRGYLMRRWIGSMAGYLVVASVVGVAGRAMRENSWLFYLLATLGIFVAAAIIYNLYRTPCPNCRKSMGSAALWIERGWIDNINHCPECGVSLDKQMPGIHT
jgi:hypothetical protein